jgi:MbtH protein
MAENGLNYEKFTGVDMSEEDSTIYKVVINHEEQYSIWPAHRENALGWKDAGKSGTKSECLEYIKEVWTDMRPLSLRKKMEQSS